MNTLIIHEDYVEFDGFSHFDSSSYVTFAFYPNAICIFGEAKEKRDYYSTYPYSSIHQIISKELVEKIQRYTDSTQLWFLWSGESYLQMEPSAPII